jgi:hypothetical protein
MVERNQVSETDISSNEVAEMSKKEWITPTLRVAVLKEAQAGFGGTYTDGSSNYATS